MLARIAQELFWLGRDLTRAEHTARMLDGAFHADVAGVPGESGIALSWEGVLAIIGAKAPAPEERNKERPEIREPDLELGRHEVARLLTLDTDSPASVVSCVSRARDRGATLRDVISTEMWEALNSFYLSLGRYDLPAALLTGPYSVYQEVKERCALFWGLVDRTMLRDEGRAFLEAGGHIEEADMVLRMLRVAVPPPPHRRLATRPRRWRCCRRSAASRRTVGRSASRRRSSRSPSSCSTTARIRARWPRRSRRCATLWRAADAQPRSSPPVLRLGRLIADLELQRRTPATESAFDEMLVRVQDELELVDRDIDDRYFAIAALAAVHL